MNTSVTIKTYSSYDVEFEFSMRVSTARGMLFITQKCNTEQETRGEFGDFLDGVWEFLNPLNVDFHLFPEYYVGPSDVIVTLRGYVNSSKGCELDKKDIKGERILGTVLLEIVKHFDIPKYYLRLSSESHDFSTFENLLVFSK